MTEKVILGLPFINALYPFLVEHDGITIDPFGQKVKFKFASKFEIDIDATSNMIHAKIKNLNSLQQEVRNKQIIDQIFDELSCDYFKNNFRGNIHSPKRLNAINYPNIINDSL